MHEFLTLTFTLIEYQCVQYNIEMQQADIMKIATLADKWAIRRDSNACMSAQMELFDVKQSDEDGRETSNTTPPRNSITFYPRNDSILSDIE